MINTDHNSIIKNDQKIQESLPEQTEPLHNYNENQNTCRICKKVLLDYISMHRFIGPECWEEFIQNINNNISLESIANKYKISINDLIIPIGTYLLDNGQTIPTIMNRLGMKKMPVIELLKIPLREKITMLHNRGLPFKYISEKLKLNVRLINRIRLENIDNRRSHSQPTGQITDVIKKIDEKNDEKGLERISYTYYGIL